VIITTLGYGLRFDWGILMSFVECLDDPAQRQMYDYWRGKRAARRMPSRRDIDPVDIPRLLPNILISEIVAGPAGVRYRYRLAGTTVARALPKSRNTISRSPFL